MANKMQIDLEAMSLKELKQLEKDARKAIQNYEQRKKNEALVAIEATAKEFGFSLSELTGASKKRSSGAAAKYRHPENAAKTWSGLGRQPAWFKEAIEAGKSKEDLAIA